MSKRSESKKETKTTVPVVETQETAEAKTEAPQTEAKVAEQPKEKVKARVKVVKRDVSLRPVMMSRTTAMFTIPPEVRDKAKLITCYNKDHRAKITWHPGPGYKEDEYPPEGEIRIRLTGKGEPSPEEMS